MKRSVVLLGLICVATFTGCCCRPPYWGSTYAAPAPVYQQQPYVPMSAPAAVNYCPCPCY